MGLNALQVLRAPAVLGSYLSPCTVACVFTLIVTWQRALRSVVSSSSETGATSQPSYKSDNKSNHHHYACVLRAPAVLGSYLRCCAVSCALALIVSMLLALRSVYSKSSQTGATSHRAMCVCTVCVWRTPPVLGLN